MEIFVESSKTDQYQDGAVVVVACTDSKYCPVAMLERYLRLANTSVEELLEHSLFRGLVSTKNEQKLQDTGGLSYSRAMRVNAGHVDIHWSKT